MSKVTQKDDSTRPKSPKIGGGVATGWVGLEWSRSEVESLTQSGAAARTTGRRWRLSDALGGRSVTRACLSRGASHGRHHRG